MTAPRSLSGSIGHASARYCVAFTICRQLRDSLNFGDTVRSAQCVHVSHTCGTCSHLLVSRVFLASCDLSLFPWPFAFAFVRVLALPLALSSSSDRADIHLHGCVLAPHTGRMQRTLNGPFGSDVTHCLGLQI